MAEFRNQFELTRKDLRCEPLLDGKSLADNLSLHEAIFDVSLFKIAECRIQFELTRSDLRCEPLQDGK